MELVGNIVIYIGLAFIFIGVIGIYRYKNFYTRLLLTTKIDTVGAITIIIGVAIRHGLSFFSLKTLLLVIIMVILDPLASHMVARSAHLSGYKTDEGQGIDVDYSEEHL